MKWALYNLLFATVYPFLLPGFLLRMLRRGGYAARMGDRFALYPSSLPLPTPVDSHSKLSPSEFIWIHAVSVGEVQVAGQLMREWRKAEPSVRFCFSTTSSTGWKMAEKEIGGNDILIYNPLDFPNFVKSALKRIRPRAIVLTESEIWPNFIMRAKKMGIPLFLINARVSDRSAPRYRAARWFFKDVLGSFTKVFAQSDLDRERLVAAGAPPEIVDVTGSFKFDVAHRNEAKEKELREWIGEGRILLGGSTWPGEDKVLLEIFKNLKDVKLVLAPRHFEKADAVEENIRSAGFDCVRRSRGDARKDSAVYLCDTTGEMMGLFGICDIAFVGKSLCAHGSQNMIEPCLCGKPTLVGPYTENFRPVMSDLLAAKAIIQVNNEEELKQGITELVKDSDAAAVFGKRAEEAVVRRCGVVSRCVASIRGLVPLFLVALLLLTGCSKNDSQPSEAKDDRQVFRPVIITSAYIAAIEKPTAVRAYFADSKAAEFAQFLEHTGMSCVTNDCEIGSVKKFDIVVYGGSEPDIDKLIDRIGESGILVRRVDVHNMSVEEFKSVVDSFPCDEMHLWMPGSEEWLLVGRRIPRKLKLDAMMDVFIRDSSFDDLTEAGATALSDIFASYVGSRSDIMDAFKADDLSMNVRPEFFITREIPEIGWIVQGDVDKDIYRRTLSEIRSMQVIRRLIVEGNMYSDSGNGEKAVESWSRAVKRNPKDVMLLERCDRLSRNASVFLRLGNVSAAAKCYETLVLINPKDAAAVFNYGICLKRLGKRELSEAVLKKAAELGK